VQWLAIVDVIEQGFAAHKFKSPQTGYKKTGTDFALLLLQNKMCMPAEQIALSVAKEALEKGLNTLSPKQGP